MRTLRKRKKVGSAAAVERAVYRTEFLINLNVLSIPSDEEITNLPPLDASRCPQEYELQARGIRRVIALASPAYIRKLRVPFCSIDVETDGMLGLRMRAVWGNRKPLVAGLSTRQEAITARALKCEANLLVNPKRLVVSLMNEHAVSKTEDDKAYWDGRTSWHAIHYLPLTPFREFGERLITSLMHIPKNVDKRIDNWLIYGDDRWMGNMHGGVRL